MRPYPLIVETAGDGQVIAQAKDVPLAIAVGRDEREAVALAAVAGWGRDAGHRPLALTPRRGPPLAHQQPQRSP